MIAGPSAIVVCTSQCDSEFLQGVISLACQQIIKFRILGVTRKHEIPHIDYQQYDMKAQYVKYLLNTWFCAGCDMFVYLIVTYLICFTM